MKGSPQGLGSWVSEAEKMLYFFFFYKQFVNIQEVILQTPKEMELVFNNNSTALLRIKGIQVK